MRQHSRSVFAAVQTATEEGAYLGAVQTATEEGAHLGGRSCDGFVVTLFLIQKVGQQQGDAILLKLQGIDDGSYRVAGFPLCLDESLELLPVQAPGQRCPHRTNGTIHCLQIVLYEGCLSHIAVCCKSSLSEALKIP